MRLEAVRKRYRRGGPWVLDGIDVDLTPGTVVQITGGNGSGKSTLLRLIAGVQGPTSGAVRDRPAVVGYVPERFPPALRFTPVEYLTALARVRGLADSDRQASELIDRFDLASHARRRLGELSKGTVQKVAVVQALLADPALLVLDESWTGLDSVTQGVLADEVQRQASHGAVVVFTDHARRAHRTRVDLHLHLEGGKVVKAAVPPPPSATRVELRDDAGQVKSLSLDPAEVDEALRQALSTGWSVLRVEPTA